MKLIRKSYTFLVLFSLVLVVLAGQYNLSHAEEDSSGDWILEQDELIKEEQKVVTDNYSQALGAARKRLFEAYFEVKTDLKGNDIRSEELGEKLDTVDQRVKALNNSIEKLDEDIVELKERITKLDRNTKKKKMQVAAAMRGIRQKEEDIEMLEGTLSEIIKQLYYKSDESTVDLLLANETFSDAIQDLDSLGILEEEASLLYEEIQGSRLELEDKKAEHKEKKEGLEKVKQALEEKQLELKTIEISKIALLEAVRAKEDTYQNELQSLEAEQIFIKGRAKTLYDSLADLGLQDKLERLEQEFGDKYTDLDGSMLWPVDPSYKGISAFFHDPGYAKRFGIMHNAIDIPAPMGTPIRAAANGVVYQAKDPEDTSYNVLFLVHSNYIMTAYGHVSDSLVQEGDIVKKGEIIALTGGMPGTLGAGYITTGPHLHFEVHENGIPVDPLTYLP